MNEKNKAEKLLEKLLERMSGAQVRAYILETYGPITEEMRQEANRISMGIAEAINPIDERNAPLTFKVLKGYMGVIKEKFPDAEKTADALELIFGKETKIMPAGGFQPYPEET